MKKKKLRSGLITIDYVIVTGIVFPISVILFWILWRGLSHLYYFTSITLGWALF